MASPRACPLRSTPWRYGALTCHRCGADLSDPDVVAYVEAARGDAAPDPSLQAAPGEAGALGAGRVLGASLAGLRDGSALRRLALLGAALSLLGFLLPAVRVWEWQPPLRWGDAPELDVTYKYAWALWREGHAVALLYPLVAALVGLAVAVVPRLSAHVRGGVLAAVGASGVVLCLGHLGSYGMAPTQVATLVTLGVLVGGVAAAARALLPGSMAARYALVASAVLILAGLVIPVGDLTPRLPYDYAFYAQWLDIDVTDAVPLTTIAKGVDRRAIGVFFVAVWMLLPLVLVPAIAALGWKRPAGVWDKDGLALRPLTWVLVLYLPILYGLMAFSATGWEDQLSKSALLGRMRLFVIALPLALWTQLGFLAVLVNARRGAPAAPREDLAAAPPAAI